MKNKDARDLSQGEFDRLKYGDMFAGAVKKIDFNGDECNNAQRKVIFREKYNNEIEEDLKSLDDAIKKDKEKT